MAQERKNKVMLTKIHKFENSWLSYQEQKDGKYVKSGNDNLFPQHLIELFNKSSIHGACVKAITEAIIGGGLSANEDFYLDNANRKGESWNDIFSKISLDYYLHGSFALEIIWSRDRSKIAEVYHIDYSHIRAKEKDHRGNIPGYFISDKWGEKGRSSVNLKDVLELPTFNPLTKQEEPQQIFVLNTYAPGKNYYPLPAYNAALKVIELDTEVDSFHLHNIKNGLAPSIAITTFTNGSDDEVRATEAMLRANYGGAENAGTLMYIDVDSPENAPLITPIPQNGADDYYTTVSDLTTQKILTAHRIVSPMILGIKTEGQLGGRAEVIDSYLLFQNTVIEPLQQDILKPIEYLLSINYPEIVIGIETKQLYDDGTVEEEVVTSVEATDNEDAEMNGELLTEQ